MLSMSVCERSVYCVINGTSNYCCILVFLGSVTLDELMTGLMSAHETFQQAMDVEIREEVTEHLFYVLFLRKQRRKF